MDYFSGGFMIFFWVGGDRFRFGVFSPLTLIKENKKLINKRI